MKLSARLLNVLKNKYVLSLLVFVVWMWFFDPKDWRLIAARKEKLRELQESEEMLNKQIKETQTELNLLKTNAQTIEKYAREKYYMKKDNEDLFVVPEQP